MLDLSQEHLSPTSRRRMRLEARRRWRQTHRSTGPRSARGKRRSSLNRMGRGLCPVWMKHDLRARGEDPKQFSALHRDLIGWLGPTDARTRFLVETLAEAWWEKMRRVRNWVGAGAPDTVETDKRIDDLLQRFVWSMAVSHRKWRYQLESAFRHQLRGPAELRWSLEARIPALGGQHPPRLTTQKQNIDRNVASGSMTTPAARARGKSHRVAGGTRSRDRAIEELLSLLTDLRKMELKRKGRNDASPGKDST